MTDIQTNFLTGSAVVGKCGSGYPTSFDPFLGSAMMMAEGVVNATARFDFSSYCASDLLGSGWKGFISDIGTSLVAMDAICYDMTGYPNRIVAEDMINVQRDKAIRNLAILKDINVQETMGVK
jgi:hypothetical protein